MRATGPVGAPGLPLSPERTRGVYWDFQGPFGVMGGRTLEMRQFELTYRFDKRNSAGVWVLTLMCSQPWLGSAWPLSTIFRMRPG